jgi:hypothetical protein
LCPALGRIIVGPNAKQTARRKPFEVQRDIALCYVAGDDNGSARNLNPTVFRRQPRNVCENSLFSALQPCERLFRRGMKRVLVRFSSAIAAIEPGLACGLDETVVSFVARSASGLIADKKYPIVFRRDSNGADSTYWASCVSPLKFRFVPIAIPIRRKTACNFWFTHIFSFARDSSYNFMQYTGLKYSSPLRLAVFKMPAFLNSAFDVFCNSRLPVRRNARSHEIDTSIMAGSFSEVPFLRLAILFLLALETEFGYIGFAITISFFGLQSPRPAKARVFCVLSLARTIVRRPLAPLRLSLTQ